jgi:hypothetical protein
MSTNKDQNGREIEKALPPHDYCSSICLKVILIRKSYLAGQGECWGPKYQDKQG